MDIKQLGAGALFTIGAIIVLKIVADKIGGGFKSTMDRV
jgi:hypothetical protein